MTLQVQMDNSRIHIQVKVSNNLQLQQRQEEGLRTQLKQHSAGEVDYQLGIDSAAAQQECFARAAAAEAVHGTAAAAGLADVCAFVAPAAVVLYYAGPYSDHKLD